jgi:hypothetical protein
MLMHGCAHENENKAMNEAVYSFLPTLLLVALLLYTSACPVAANRTPIIVLIQ